MKLNVTKYKVKSENEREKTLSDLAYLLEVSKNNFDMFSLNRYLNTKINEVDFSKMTTKEWFKKEHLTASENPLYPFGIGCEDFFLFLNNYIRQNHQIELSDIDVIYRDYQYIDFLVFIAFNDRMEHLEKKYVEVFNEEPMFLNSFVVTKIGMNFGDELPLETFINMMLGLHARTYIKENIDLLGKGEDEIYNIEPFKN